MRSPVDALLEDQVLLGERLGLAVVPRRAERMREVVREAERDIRVACEAGGVPPRLAQEPLWALYPNSLCEEAQASVLAGLSLCDLAFHHAHRSNSYSSYR